MEEKKLLFLSRGEIRTIKPFCELFQIKPNDLKHIAEDMRKNGYDYAHPIILWRGAVVDGHTRLAAAKLAGIGDIPVVPRNFGDEREALEYAIKSQSNRRNLSDAELMACISELDRRKPEGRPKKTPTSVGVLGESAERTAELLGVNRGKVEKIRTVQDHASDTIKQAVSSGEMSINKAYNETMQQRRGDDGDSAVAEKPARISAIVKSIDGMIAKRMEREVQEYPDLEYSAEDKENIKQQIFAVIEKHIDSLPQMED